MASFGSSEIGQGSNKAYPTLAAEVMRAVERLNWLEVAHANERNKARELSIQIDDLHASEQKARREVGRLLTLLRESSSYVPEGKLADKIAKALGKKKKRL